MNGEFIFAVCWFGGGIVGSALALRMIYRDTGKLTIANVGLAFGVILFGFIGLGLFIFGAILAWFEDNGDRPILVKKHRAALSAPVATEQPIAERYEAGQWR